MCTYIRMFIHIYIFHKVKCRMYVRALISLANKNLLGLNRCILADQSKQHPHIHKTSKFVKYIKSTEEEATYTCIYIYACMYIDIERETRWSCITMYVWCIVQVLMPHIRTYIHNDTLHVASLLKKSNPCVHACMHTHTYLYIHIHDHPSCGFSIILLIYYADQVPYKNDFEMPSFCTHTHTHVLTCIHMHT